MTLDLALPPLARELRAEAAQGRSGGYGGSELQRLRTLTVVQLRMVLRRYREDPEYAQLATAIQTITHGYTLFNKGELIDAVLLIRWHLSGNETCK